jgi:hypothetical protein
LSAGGCVKGRSCRGGAAPMATEEPPGRALAPLTPPAHPRLPYRRPREPRAAAPAAPGRGAILDAAVAGARRAQPPRVVRSPVRLCGCGTAGRAKPARPGGKKRGGLRRRSRAKRALRSSAISFRVSRDRAYGVCRGDAATRDGSGIGSSHRRCRGAGAPPLEARTSGSRPRAPDCVRRGPSLPELVRISQDLPVPVPGLSLVAVPAAKVAAAAAKIAAAAADDDDDDAIATTPRPPRLPSESFGPGASVRTVTVTVMR